MALSRLAQLCDDLWGKRNPSRSVRSSSNTFERSCIAPVGNGRDVHIEQFSSSKRRVASITSLPAGTEAGPFGTVESNIVGSTNPFHFARRKAATQSRLPSLLIEQQCDLRRSMGGSQFTNPSYHLRISAACIGHQLRSSDGQCCQCFRSPTNTYLNTHFPSGERHVLDEEAHQLFALCWGGGWSVPDSRNILRQHQNALPLLRSEDESSGLGDGRILSMQLLHLNEFLIPVSFQAASHETILWINGCVATTSQIGLILRSFQPELPLSIKVLRTSFQMIKRGERNGQVSGLNGCQKAGRDSLVNAIASHRLTHVMRNELEASKQKWDILKGPL